ncbi:MAG: hypothetical protein Kow0037_12990 [Calditrichia bacterium]
MHSKAYFNRVARDWDEMRRSFFPDSLRDAAIAAGEPIRGLTCVDLGAGSGFLSAGLLAHGAEVLSLDQSEEMLKLLNEKFGHSRHFRTQLVIGKRLPLADRSADRIFANMFLHHVENPPEMIAECYRILRPGGKLVITDLDRHQYEFLLKEHYDRWPGFERRHIETWFKKAGFKEISVKDAGSRCTGSSLCTCDQASISIFLAISSKESDG